MPPSLRQLLDIERDRRTRADRAFADIADAVRSIASACNRIEEGLAGWPAPAPGKTTEPRAPTTPASELGAAVLPRPDPAGERDATVWLEAGRSSAPSETIRKLDELRDHTNGVATQLLALVDTADRLAQGLGAAREIAERIDLLALNAALDATRSDPGARGLARSASEIRDQVVRWIRTAQQLEPLAGDIREEVGRAVLAADGALRRSASARQDAVLAGQEIEQLTDLLRRTLESASRSLGSSSTAEAPAASASTEPPIDHTEQLAIELRAVGARLQELLLGNGR